MRILISALVLSVCLSSSSFNVLIQFVSFFFIHVCFVWFCYVFSLLLPFVCSCLISTGYGMGMVWYGYCDTFIDPMVYTIKVTVSFYFISFHSLHFVVFSSLYNFRCNLQFSEENVNRVLFECVCLAFCMQVKCSKQISKQNCQVQNINKPMTIKTHTKHKAKQTKSWDSVSRENEWNICPCFVCPKERQQQQKNELFHNCETAGFTRSLPPSIFMNFSLNQSDEIWFY